MSNYTDLQVNSVEINKDSSQFTAKDAVTKSYVDTRFTDLIDAAPGALDTLNELAAALNDDASFSATVTNNIATETAARTAADTDLQNQISNLSQTSTTNLNNEAAARAAADSTLQSNIDSEAADRAAADSTLQDNIDSEEAARTAADSTLQSNIDSEATARTDADSTLQSNIDSEATARTAADSTLQSNIDSEAADRAAADSTLQDNIDSEEAARTAADSTLQSNIDSEAAQRLLADNNEATTRADADNALDVAKLDKSDRYSKRFDGHFALATDSYLYIGDAWRITASNIGQTKKLQIEYTEDGLNWNVGIPFIRETPALPASITDLVADDQNVSVNVMIQVINNEGYPVKLVGNGENIPIYINEANYDVNNRGASTTGGVTTYVNPYEGTLNEQTFVMHYNALDDASNRIYDIQNVAESQFGNQWYAPTGAFALSSLSTNPLDVSFASGAPDFNHFQLEDIEILSTVSFKAKVRLAGFNNSGNNYLAVQVTNDSVQYALGYSVLVSQAEADFHIFTIQP